MSKSEYIKMLKMLTTTAEFEEKYFFLMLSSTAVCLSKKLVFISLQHQSQGIVKYFFQNVPIVVRYHFEIWLNSNFLNFSKITKSFLKIILKQQNVFEMLAIIK